MGAVDKPRTRQQQIIDKGGEPLMPELDEVTYVAEYWTQSGMYIQSGNGPVRLTAQEVQCWSAGAIIPLNAWEFRSIIGMSEAYLSGFADGKDPLCTPPYGEAPSTQTRTAVGRGLQAMLEAMKNKAKK